MPAPHRVLTADQEERVRRGRPGMTFRRRRHRLDLASALLVILLVMLCFAPAPAAADATGFFVSAEGHFVSAYHVLDNCAFAGIKTPDGVLIGDLVAGSAAAS